MLKKALLKALTNLTPEEKDEVRKSLGGGQPASEENVDEHEGKGAEKNEKRQKTQKRRQPTGARARKISRTKPTQAKKTEKARQIPATKQPTPIPPLRKAERCWR